MSIAIPVAGTAVSVGLFGAPVVNALNAITDGTNVATAGTGSFGGRVTYLNQYVYAQVRQTIAQTIPNSVGTALTFGTEDFDTNNGHDNSTNPSRWTAPLACVVALSGCVAWSANATGRRGGWWTKNATAINGSQFIYAPTSSADIEVSAGEVFVQLAIGDYVELYAYHEKGSSLDTSSTGQVACRMSIKVVALI